MNVRTGIDIISINSFSDLKGRHIGLVVHPASISSDLDHTADILFTNQDKGYVLKALFGPQHGFWGNTQDNMIEWKGFKHQEYNIPVYSLYGNYRKPIPEMLSDVDTLVFDVQDVGSRYYTFIWTMALCMQACAENDLSMLVLDRPNPIGGTKVEGPVLEKKFSSFVGLYPVTIRHGMTIGELALLFNNEFGINCDLKIIAMDGWQRGMWFEKTGLPWVMPSPNMPSPDTALVYPGMCLLEGTNISEGRGTTRPFEIFGAPYIDPWLLKRELDLHNLPGVVFRPLFFQPAFSKWQGELCGGLQIHVTDRDKYLPVLTGITVINTVNKLYPIEFKWLMPPYEYEYKKIPFNILTGNDWIKKMLDKGDKSEYIKERWIEGLQVFKSLRNKYLLY